MTPPMNGAWPCSTSMPLVREFFHGDPERYPEAVAMIRHNPDTQDQWAYHYLHDVLGSAIGLVDSAGTLVERYTYDPYGKVFIEKWDATANGGQGAFVASETDCGTSNPACGRMPYSPTGNPFLWTGHRYDPAVGLYHTLYRTYSPTLGRWLQRDPIGYFGGSINLYEYVNSSPLNDSDPFGDQPKNGPTEIKNFREFLIEKGCKPGCANRCGRDKDGNPTEGCNAVSTDLPCWNECMKKCRAEANRLVGLLRGSINCGNKGAYPGNCASFSNYLKYVFDQHKWEFFGLNSIELHILQGSYVHKVVAIWFLGMNSYVQGFREYLAFIDAVDFNRASNQGDFKLNAFEGGRDPFWGRPGENIEGAAGTQYLPTGPTQPVNSEHFTGHQAERFPGNKWETQPRPSQ
ncbi:MAG: hypothetical protein DCC63_18685 [Nitrospira sp.]|nr:MAG: hypothetical protein DCC63_18685 [Nitrospira sp.]